MGQEKVTEYEEISEPDQGEILAAEIAKGDVETGVAEGELPETPAMDDDVEDPEEEEEGDA